MATSDLHKLLGKRGAPEALRYVCVVQSPLGEMPAGVLASHNGLDAVQSINANGAYLHVAFWSSRDHYDHGRQRFAQDMQAGEPVCEGVAAPIATRTPPLYKRFKLSTYVLSAAALFGAFEALSKRYEDLVAAPDAVVKLDGRKHNLVEEERLAVNATIENLLAVANLRDVKVEASLDSPTGPSRPVEILDGRMPSIQATKERTFKVETTPPGPGTYKLTVSVKACAGQLLCPWPKTFTQTAEVRVFPKYPRGALRVARSTPTSAELAVSVETGTSLKETAVCEITFPPGPAIRYEPAYTADTAKFDALVGDDKLTRAGLVWPIGKASAKADVTRTFSFIASVPVDWSKIASSAQVHCSRE